MANKPKKRTKQCCACVAKDFRNEIARARSWIWRRWLLARWHDYLLEDRLGTEIFMDGCSLFVHPDIK